MEHHLGFGRFRLQRGRNRSRGEGVGGTFMGIISLPEAGKSSIFVSSWTAEPAGEWLRVAAEWGKKLARQEKPCDR